MFMLTIVSTRFGDVTIFVYRKTSLRKNRAIIRLTGQTVVSTTLRARKKLALKLK
jgi:hypothetical protein